MFDEVESRYSVWRDYYFGIQGVFYFAQGIAMGALFFLTAFLDFLSLSPFERIAVQAIIWLPWYLKIIFGILSDNVPIRKYGRRKPYIFTAGIIGVIGWLTLPLHAVFGPLLLVSGILASLGTSMSDATIDALAVDITPPQKRGMMQGVSWGSRGIGVGISGLVVGVLADANQWFTIYAVPGVIVSLACFLVLLFKENPLPPDFKRVAVRVYKDVLKTREVLVCMLFQILSGAAIAILAIMQTYLDEAVGFDNATIGVIFVIFSLGMFTGAVVFGLLGDKVSVRLTLPITSAIYAILVISVLMLNLGDFAVASTFFLLVGIANGGYEATQMRISMDNSPSIVAGSMYNLYNSLSNLGQTAIGALMIAALVEALSDFRLGWQLAVVFLVVALLPGYLLARWREERGPSSEEELTVIDGESL